MKIRKPCLKPKLLTPQVTQYELKQKRPLFGLLLVEKSAFLLAKDNESNFEITPQK
jgi:hypothetical protein